MAAFCFYVYPALHICSDLSDLSNELNYLKFLDLSRGSTHSVIYEALNKFKKPKHSVCHSDLCLNPAVLSFYSSISFKISEILSCFGVKVSFRPANKFKFSSLKDPILIENRSGNYF